MYKGKHRLGPCAWEGEHVMETHVPTLQKAWFTPPGPHSLTRPRSAGDLASFFPEEPEATGLGWSLLPTHASSVHSPEHRMPASPPGAPRPHSVHPHPLPGSPLAPTQPCFCHQRKWAVVSGRSSGGYEGRVLEGAVPDHCPPPWFSAHLAAALSLPRQCCHGGPQASPGIPPTLLTCLHSCLAGPLNGWAWLPLVLWP